MQKPHRAQPRWGILEFSVQSPFLTLRSLCELFSYSFRTKNAYCSAVNGTTDNLPILINGDSRKILSF